MVLCAASTASFAQRVPAPCVLPEQGQDKPALTLADMSASCLEQYKPNIAGKIFYAHVIRARTLAALDPDPRGWAAYVMHVQAQIGAPANRWLGGDIDGWREAIDWALAWDNATPWNEGVRLSKTWGLDGTKFAAARDKSRQAVWKLGQDLSQLDRVKFYGKRIAQGLEVREEGGIEKISSKPRSK